MGKFFATLLALFVYFCGFIQVALSQESSTWSYMGDTGPTHWGELSREYSMCQQGMNQSPIDIVDTTFDRLFALDFDYRPTPLRVSKRNHTLEIDYGTPSDKDDHTLAINGQEFTLPSYTNYNSRIIVSGEVYTLETIQFRAPSEHSVENKQYDMEAQMIHRNDYDQIAIVAVLIKTGKKNYFIDKLWGKSPITKTSDTPSHTINMTEILPEDRGYYHYRGSLTTPPCDEGVRWFVMKEPIHISNEQIEKFTGEVGFNNRPLQPRNYRFLLESL